MDLHKLAAKEEARMQKASKFTMPSIPKGIGYDSTDAELQAAMDNQAMNRELDESLAMLNAIIKRDK